MAKKEITIIACQETYKNLSTFTEIEELNKTVRYYKENFKKKLSKSSIAVLDQLHRYSAKYLGCSFRSKGNIAETLNISRRTVIRACQLLEQLGIIKQHEMKRMKDMHQTSNCIVILPVVTQDKPEIEEECHTKTNPISLKQNIVKERNERLTSEFVSSRVPKKFTQYVQCFYHDAHTIEELFQVVLIATRYYFKYSEKERVKLGLDAFKQLIRNIKMGRKVRNIFGYFWGIVNGMLDQDYYEMMASPA